MPGYFELRKSSNGQFRFLLKAGNGEVILTSELYKTRSGAEGGIDAVRKNSQVNTRFEKKAAANGKPMFNLKAGNGQVIGTSELYATDAARDGGIESVKANGSSKTVRDAVNI
jgi:uncharacterized protein YegP (UPF0339 family)